MSERTDLEDMIDVLTIAIAREETEERFFRHSSETSEHEVAKKMFLEIATEIAAFREGLESRRERLLETLSELRTVRE